MADLHDPSAAFSGRRAGRHSATQTPPAGAGAGPVGSGPVIRNESAQAPVGAAQHPGARMPAATAPSGLPIVDAVRVHRARTDEIAWNTRASTDSSEPEYRPLSAYLPDFRQVPAGMLTADVFGPGPGSSTDQSGATGPRVGDPGEDRDGGPPQGGATVPGSAVAPSTWPGPSSRTQPDSSSRRTSAPEAHAGTPIPAAPPTPAPAVSPVVPPAGVHPAAGVPAGQPAASAARPQYRTRAERRRAEALQAQALQAQQALAAAPDTGAPDAAETSDRPTGSSQALSSQAPSSPTPSHTEPSYPASAGPALPTDDRHRTPEAESPGGPAADPARTGRPAPGSSGHRRAEPGVPGRAREDFPDDLGDGHQRFTGHRPAGPGETRPGVENDHRPDPVGPMGRSTPVPPAPRSFPTPTSGGPGRSADLDEWSPAQARQARAAREQAERARDQSDELWLRELTRPQTPEGLFPDGEQRDSASALLAPPPGRSGEIPAREQMLGRDRSGDRFPSARDESTGSGRLLQDTSNSGWTAGQQSLQRSGKPRLAWIDTARGLAIVLVVLLHATDWIQETPINIEAWDHANEVINTLRMPLFFMCAGILATKWLYAAWADLIAKKVFFLGWLYLLWQLVGSLEAVVAAQITGDQLTPVRMLLSLAMTPVRPRFELWFIWALALFFLINRYCSRFPLGPQLTVGLLMGFFAFSSLVPQVNLGWNGFLEYYLFFLIGCYYRPLLLALAERLTRPLAGAVVVGWTVLTSITYFTGLIYVPGIGLAVRLLGLVAGVGVALVLQNVRIFAYLGSRTLQIYLAHTPIIVVMALLLDHVSLTGPARLLTWLLPLVFTVAAVWLSLKLHTVLIRTRARVMYEPPAALTSRVRDWVARRPDGTERLYPSEVPGLQQRPLERQLERALA